MNYTSEKETGKMKKELLWLSILLAFNLCIFPPCELYLSNINEFWFSFVDIIPIIITSALTTLIVINIMGYVLPYKLYYVFFSMLFGCAMAAYIQGNYLNNNYGVLDGKNILWSEYSTRGKISLAVWGIVIASVVWISYKYKNHIQKIIKITCIVLIIMQAAALVFMVCNASKKKVNGYVASTNGLFEYSTEQNIVVMCLDTFDSNVFSEMIKEYPEYEKIFKDFTFYDNTSGMYPTTKASIPYILTGIPYENQETYDEYLSKAYQKAELFDNLEANDFQYSIYTTYGINDTILEKCANGIQNSASISSYKELGTLLYKASLFKYVPQQAKQLCWIYTADFETVKKAKDNVAATYNAANSNFDFIELMSNLDWKTTPQKQFKFIHLRGLHEPYDMNENMQQVEKSTYMEQGLGLANLIKEYIENLKKIDAYNNTCLIILADHGSSAFSTYCQSPLCLIKEAEVTRDTLTVDSVPLSFSALSQIYLNQIENNSSTTLTQVIHELAENERRFLHYDWDDKWDADYMPAMREYYIGEDVNDTSCFVSTGKTYTSKLPEIQIDKALLFYKDKSANDYFLQGLKIPGDEYTWTYGNSGIVRCTTDKRENIYVVLKYAKTNGKQHLKISLGDNILYDQFLSQNGSIFFTIPGNLIQELEGFIELYFEYDKVPSNKDVGVAYSELYFSLEPKVYKEISIDQMLSFKEGVGSANDYFLQGLSNAEEQFTWTEGQHGELYFHTNLRENINIELTYIHIYAEPQVIRINWEDRLLAEETLSSQEGKIAFEIPAEILEETKGYIKLDLIYPNATSPQKCGESDDTRDLSIALQEMVFRKKD